MNEGNRKKEKKKAKEIKQLNKTHTKKNEYHKILY